MPDILDTKIEYLKGVGQQKAALLNTELGIFTYRDLLEHYPFRHEDRTKFYNIAEITEDYPYVQLRGFIDHIQLYGEGNKKRLIAQFSDATGTIELVWFQGIQWMLSKLKLGVEYVVFGKPNLFGRRFSIAHPDIEPCVSGQSESAALIPVYSTTEKLKKRFLDSKAIALLQKNLLETVYAHIEENLPPSVIEKYKLLPRRQALLNIHFPKTPELLRKALIRMKFEEFFFIQLRLLMQMGARKQKSVGQIFRNVHLLTCFYKQHLPFELTDAQKRVIKEIFADMKSGRQMNRLLQGDVGSGKTIVAFICMLIAIDNGAQACLMAPTEILAEQHYNSLKIFADSIGVRIAKLTGATKLADRRTVLEELKDGSLPIVVGTHALIEETVQFHNLGLCIIDEQHRFGVAQRAKLWEKNPRILPHVLVMTATPIPRTLAMTLYGDLDVSVIDQLPAGRKPIQTMHYYDAQRLKVFAFIKQQIALGRQAYIVYPLIEESEKVDYKNLIDGYESVCRAFPDVPVSIVHGKMKPQDKEFEMQRFVRGETKIMVATTVIEVGVNVPNANVMVIENAEKFGLAQLHQLRGRVGRGTAQSYCILMTDFKLSKEAKLRIETMVRTNNGFEIADMDLRLRGPGDLEGTQQSGITDLRLADISRDQKILQAAREAAAEILAQDPQLTHPEHLPTLHQLEQKRKQQKNWGQIS
ncbi:MAG: ATP-dependent DNA helicase RecG [Cytophagales bacterium]|nr:ATP-dependent DNA helicase RecG [Bernardetiaceae bacterium]MDW8205743.1 ATP-dependent DNA helicase RecG [Cytophagales bacterium]